MNTNLGLIGKKLGNTQIFDEEGNVLRVTAIEAGPCVVLAKRTPDKHGYAALQLGFGTRKEKHTTKPELGYFKKQGIEGLPKVAREFRIPADMLDKFEVGQELKVGDVFKPGMFVDVRGKSKGRGFAGVIKRHGFAGAATMSHGTHEYKRHGGSIGCNMTPGRTMPGKGMPGQYGNVYKSVLNLRVARVLEDDQIVLVEGGVPGPKQGFVTVRGAVKKATVTPKVAEA